MRRLLWKEAREQWPYALAVLAVPVLMLVHARLVRHRPLYLSGHDDLFFLFIAVAVYGATRLPHERSRGRLTLFTLPVPAWMLWTAKILPGLAVSLLAVWLTGLLAEPARVGIGPVSPEKILSIAIVRGYGIAALAYAGAFLASLGFGVLPSVAIAALVAFFSPGLIYRLVASLGEGSGSPQWLETVAEAGFIGYAWLAALGLLLASVIVLRSRLYISDLRWTRWTAGILTSAVLLLPLAGVASADEELRSYFVEDGRPDNARTAPVVSRRYGRVAYAEEVYDYHGHGSEKVFFYRSTLWVRRLDGHAPVKVEQLENSHVPGNRTNGYPDIAPIGWVSGGRLLYAARTSGARETVLKLWTPGDGPAVPLTSFVAARPDIGEATDLLSVEPGGARVAVLRPAAGSLLPGGSYDLWRFDIPTRRWTLLVPGPYATGVAWRSGRIYLDGDDDLTSIAPEGGEVHDEEQLPAEEVER